MREINKNPNVDISKVQQIKPTKAEEVIAQPAVENEEKVNKDFSAKGGEVLGRSQVGSPDALQKDVAFGMSNPDAIAQADKFFNIALAQLEAKGVEDSYAKASELSKTFVNEFITK